MKISNNFHYPFFYKLIVFTANGHRNICIAGLNRQDGYATAGIFFVEIDQNISHYKCLITDVFKTLLSVNSKWAPRECFDSIAPNGLPKCIDSCLYVVHLLSGFLPNGLRYILSEPFKASSTFFFALLSVFLFPYISVFFRIIVVLIAGVACVQKAQYLHEVHSHNINSSPYF